MFVYIPVRKLHEHEHGYSGNVNYSFVVPVRENLVMPEKPRLAVCKSTPLFTQWLEILRYSRIPKKFIFVLHIFII